MLHGGNRLVTKVERVGVAPERVVLHSGDQLPPNTREDVQVEKISLDALLQIVSFGCVTA